MGRKAKYSLEQKVKACEEYLHGIKSAVVIARELNMGKYGKCRVFEWSKKYKAFGPSAFEDKPRNKSYSKEFKETVVREYLSGCSSYETLIIKYQIPSIQTIADWIKKYNNHIELRDYNPKPEVYMNDTLKTTREERIEIVEWCLKHNKDYKATAAHFNGKYAQIYQWVRKYELYGEEGLNDKRGRRKPSEELTELEKAQRRISQLEREKEEIERRYEVLKKAEMTERW